MKLGFAAVLLASVAQASPKCPSPRIHTSRSLAAAKDSLASVPPQAAPELENRGAAFFVDVPFTATFDELHDLGLGIEVHAGEFAGAESVRAALRCARPHRLGHAIAAFSDQALVAEIAERDIHVEFCPSSNLALGVVRSLAEHPIGRARDVAFSINTDDPGPFACSLTSELELAARTFGFDHADLERIFENTMRAAFRGR